MKKPNKQDFMTFDKDSYIESLQSYIQGSDEAMHMAMKEINEEITFRKAAVTDEAIFIKSGLHLAVAIIKKYN